MKSEIITTEIHHTMAHSSPVMLIKVILDELVGINASYDRVNWVMQKVADKIFEKIYPDIEKKIMADPELTKRITNEVLLKITGKVLDKMNPKKESKSSRSHA